MHSPANTQDDGLLTVDQAIANLQGDDLGLRVYAAWWLGRFRVRSKPAIQVLITALQDEDDRTAAGGYPLRRNAARALGKLEDREAVPPLIKALSCTDFYTREAAAQALERLGDERAVPTLLQLLHQELPGTEPAPEPPQLPQPFDAIIEALGALGTAATALDIQPFLEFGVPRIEFAAARALYQLTADPQVAQQYGDRLVQGLSHPDLRLRRAALTDLGAIGYFPAAQAIANTRAENSVKLIALKGLLEVQLRKLPLPKLSPEAQSVMALMDELL